SLTCSTKGREGVFFARFVDNILVIKSSCDAMTEDYTNKLGNHFVRVPHCEAIERFGTEGSNFMQALQIACTNPKAVEESFPSLQELKDRLKQLKHHTEQKTYYLLSTEVEVSAFS